MKKLFISFTSLCLIFLLAFMISKNTSSVFAANQENSQSQAKVQKTVVTSACSLNHENCNEIHKSNDTVLFENTKQTTCPLNHQNCNGVHQSNNKQASINKTNQVTKTTPCPYNHPNCDGTHQNGNCTNNHTNCNHDSKQGANSKGLRKHSNNHNGSKHH